MHRRGADEKEDHLSDLTIQAYNETHHTANGDLRGTKADVWEAGHRVPFLRAGRGGLSPAQNAPAPPRTSTCLPPAPRSPGPRCRTTAAEDSFSWLPLFRGGDWAKPRPAGDQPQRERHVSRCATANGSWWPATAPADARRPRANRSANRTSCLTCRATLASATTWPRLSWNWSAD